MKISGKLVAEELREELKTRINKLLEKGIVPKIAIITLGAEGSWESYVKQKLKVAEELGITAVLINLKDADEEKLLKTVAEIDSDPKYHGLIVQRPMPASISREKVVNAISAEKDTDGFRPDSRCGVPVWLAAKKLMEVSLKETGLDEKRNELKFVVIGKGETAGGPTAKGLIKMGIVPTVIDSKTENPEEILKKADVIITCVGRSGVIKPEQIKPGVILIGVGTHNEEGPPGPINGHVEAGRLRGDYVDSEIENIAGSYTPTPGGIGPVNLTYLFTNLIDATEANS